MAKLDNATRDAWNNALRDTAAEWIVFGLDGRVASRAERIGGMVGLIDWRLHGQVSKLLASDKIVEEEFCLMPGGVNNFLLYQYGEAPSVPALVGRLRKLAIPEICLAESTFPEDFLGKLKQTLKKEGIRSTKLEPTTE